jgi:hypothetical protein
MSYAADGPGVNAAAHYETVVPMHEEGQSREPPFEEGEEVNQLRLEAARRMGG